LIEERIEMKDTTRIKRQKLKRRQLRVRKSVHGTGARPRLVVFRSLKHVRAQLVDDDARCTLAQVSSTAKTLSDPAGEGSLKMRRSEAVGQRIAELAVEKGIKEVAFDRGGRLYHGRLKAVADAARKGGLEF
jgi:large subunit ribosomal protein L18